MSDRVAGCFERTPLEGAIEIEFADNDAAVLVTGPVSHAANSGALTHTLLPIAPRRWLWLNPLPDRVAELERTGAITVDVDGKWVAYSAEETRALTILSTAFDFETVMQKRMSASITLFDCPAVVARIAPDRVLVCVAASYASSFEAAVEQVVAEAGRGNS